ncbi:MAG: 2,3-bisphosphoglycerate-independent phosphoglycerate mutase [Veillonella sp.]|nr:2,3-bisphosphoglycerate-independent phosphoglycerate mutase [Veillonella sp.]
MAKLEAPVMLVILDGFGLGDKSDTTNAVVQAKPLCFNRLWDMYPHTTLEASGLAVGLPEGQMGNSEVGHLNLGSGRIVYQDLTRITKDVESGEFYNRPVMKELYEVAKKQSLHLIGLVSDGNVHCSLDHIKAVIKGAHDNGIEHVYVHALLDGRDVAPQCAQGYLKDLETYMADLNCGKIATVSGRYYAMDRDNRWDRVELAYNAIVHGQGEKATSACEAVQQSYEYEDGLPVHIVYEKDTLSETLGEVLSAGGYRQLRIAETEKYAHVTYFFNGGEEEPFEGEDRILVKSPQVATYDLQPEMSAYEVTDKVVQAIQDETYDMIILNFANPDMVGHTGSFEAAVKAVQAVDTCLGRIVEAIRSKKGHLLVTADHGNAELMVNHETGKVHTAHTTNLVPLILMSDSLKTATLEAGKLCDIAPTLLDLAGIKQPKAMTGHSLVHKA